MIQFEHRKIPLNILQIIEMSTEKHSEFKLDAGVWNDPISSVCFDKSNSRSLLVSSWDCSLRLFDISQNSQKQSYPAACPLLDCCFVVSLLQSSLPFPNVLFMSFLLPPAKVNESAFPPLIRNLIKSLLTSQKVKYNQ